MAYEVPKVDYVCKKCCRVSPCKLVDCRADWDRPTLCPINETEKAYWYIEYEEDEPSYEDD